MRPTVAADRFEPSASLITRVGKHGLSEGSGDLPKALRDRLGIRAGEVLEIHEERGRLVAVKATADDLDRQYGILRLDGGSDRAVEELRGPAGLE